MISTAPAVPKRRSRAGPGAFEELGQELARRRIVVDDQDSLTVEPHGKRITVRRLDAALSGAASSRTGIGSDTLNVAPWPSPALSARTGPAVQFDQVLDDRQAKTEAAVAAVAL